MQHGEYFGFPSENGGYEGRYCLGPCAVQFDYGVVELTVEIIAIKAFPAIWLDMWIT